MNDQDLSQARTALESILNALGVVRVVYVDDLNTTTPTVEDTIAASMAIDAADLQPLFPELGETLPGDPDILRKKIRDVWDSLGGKVQTERGKAIIVAARRHDGDETDDTADIAVLEQIIPQDRLISLSPPEWGRQQEQLLEESRTSRTLFIFDRDLSGAGGDPEGGIKIIASLLAHNGTGSVICGLLTHTVNPATQPEQWAELSSAHSIPMDRFVVIPKLHLSKAPMLFAQMLKYAALAPEFTELKGKAKDIIRQAADTAAAEVDKVRIHDLDHMVFRVSADEGVWEPEMLFRLHALFHRLEARRLAHEGGDLERLAERLRIVSGIPTECGDFEPPSSAWLLQKQELYEQNEHINRYHLPLELGDIFERVGSESTKKYILLIQPCDLMVRGDGKRSPELKRVPLVEIAPEVAPAAKPPKYSEEMPYFDTLPSKKWYVKFKTVHYVRGCLLDLCVFNQDGVARLIVGGSAPSGIRPAWKERYKIMSRYWGSEVRKTDILTPAVSEAQALTQVKQAIARNFNSLLFDDDLFKGILAEAGGVRIVTYNCKRVGRLSRAHAIGLLMSYTATLGRPAYERDFGNIGK